jgi:hypothetical protein
MGNEMDKFEIALEDKTKELQACQVEKGYKSCLPCPQINECKLRDEYVDAVYDSMNKGQGGGFEF